jgi:hypothetical protein
MIRILTIIAVLMGVLGVIATVTQPAVSKPPNETGNGSLFAGIGL